MSLFGEIMVCLFAWLLDNLESDFESYGWSGVQGLPRSLWLRGDGILGIAPVKELENFRAHKQVYAGLENELPARGSYQPPE